MNANPTFRFSSVILAAGLSSRMGGRFKMLLDCGGQPMIRRTVRAILDAKPVETVVVLGHRREEVRAVLADLGVRFVVNPDYAQGQHSSVAAGCKALEQYTHAVMIGLGDQPLLLPSDIARLAAAFMAMEDGRTILVPHHLGQRGNPILMSAAHLPDVTGRGLNIGCRKLIENNPDLVATPDLGSEAYVRDCDTLEDYQRLILHFATAPRVAGAGGDHAVAE